jgi:DNA-binding NtrC family response regulator
MGRAAVLIIDDDPDFRELTQLCLEGVDVDVLEAGDCCRGIELLGEAPDRVAVILLDYWMPGMTPVHCVARIRELMAPGSRLILVTAAVDARMRARELGIADCLPKPLDSNLLREIVRAATESTAREPPNLKSEGSSPESDYRRVR